MDAQPESFLALINSRRKFRLYLLSRLPSAFFSGVNIVSLSEIQSIVTVPYKWFSKNPFNSTYFACLAMAAEMSTGLLAMMHVYKRIPSVSMLVVQMEAKYFKKATGLSSFTCLEGAEIKDAIQQAINTSEGQTIRVKSTGTNQSGELVAEFFIIWSFKLKKSI